MARRVVGLELGHHSIRAVQVALGSATRPKVEKFLDFPIQSSVDHAGRIADVDALASDLRRLWNTAKFKTKEVAIGLGGADVFVREFQVPEMQIDTLKQALPAIAEGNLPMPTSELVLDFYASALVETESDRKISGLLLAATKTSAESLLEAVGRAGLHADQVDLIPFSLIRHFSRRGINSEVIAVVHASNGILNVIVTRGDIPVFVRLIPMHFSEQSLSVVDATPDSPQLPTSGLSSELIDLENGDFGPLANGTQSQSNDEMFSVASLDPLEAFHLQACRELAETFAYYRANHEADPISQIRVSGMTLDEPIVLERLAEMTNLEVVSQFHVGIGHRKIRANKDSKIQSASEYSVALALAGGVGE